MKKASLTTTIAATVLAFGLAACDQQQADSGDGSSVPMQQQGAVPESPATTGGESSTALPGTSGPDSSEPATMEPGTIESGTQNDLPTPADTTE